MRSLGERFHILRKLLNLRIGPGAAVLPPDITQIHLHFGMSTADGHMGAKKFWRENLPRLKYHNPSVPMIVNRHTNTSDEPIITIYMRIPGYTSADPENPSAAPAGPLLASSFKGLCKPRPPLAGERIAQVSMRNKHSTIILDEFLEATGAVRLAPTPEELEEAQSLEELRITGDLDRRLIEDMKIARRREQDMMDRARAAGAPISE